MFAPWIQAMEYGTCIGTSNVSAMESVNRSEMHRTFLSVSAFRVSIDWDTCTSNGVSGGNNKTIQPYSSCCCPLIYTSGSDAGKSKLDGGDSHELEVVELKTLFVELLFPDSEA